MSAKNQANKQEISEKSEVQLDIFQVLGVLSRSKFWVSLGSVIGLCIGIWYCFFLATPLYTASAKVALESRQQQIMDIESVVSGLSGDQATINTEVEVIRSRNLVERLVLDRGLQEDPEFNKNLREEPFFSLGKLKSLIKKPDVKIQSERQILDSVIDSVARTISISNIRQSYVIRVSITTSEATKSADLANRLAELYIEDQIAVKFSKTKQAASWLTERVQELQISLETSEEKLKLYSANTDLVSPEGLVALNRQLKDLRDRRKTISADGLRVKSRLEKLESLTKVGTPKQIASFMRDTTLTELSGYIKGDADEKKFRDRLDLLNKQLSLEAVRNDSQLNALDISIDEVTGKISVQSSELVKLQQLQREAEASRIIYEAFLTRLKETSIQQGIHQADSRVLSVAVVPLEPSAPRTKTVLGLMTFLGAIIAFGAVVLHEATQNTFRLAEDLEAKTGYTVLGQIPKIVARKRASVLKYLVDKPNSAAAEALRNLRTSLLLSNLDNDLKIIMSTSSVPGEGKTTQSIALAQNFSGLGEKVLLIEGDIRRRVFSEYFSIDKTEGYLSVLSGAIDLDEAIVSVDQLGADVLIGENSSINAADLFSSDSFAKLLASLRDKYDRIIIDTPPVLAVPDARVIGQRVDAIIYTVRWDSTPQRQVVEGLKSLEAVNLRVSGLVLGQIDRNGMKRYGLGEGYGSYEGYHQN